MKTCWKLGTFPFRSSFYLFSSGTVPYLLLAHMPTATLWKFFRQKMVFLSFSKFDTERDLFMSRFFQQDCQNCLVRVQMMLQENFWKKKFLGFRTLTYFFLLLVTVFRRGCRNCFLQAGVNCLRKAFFYKKLYFSYFCACWTKRSGIFHGNFPVGFWKLHSTCPDENLWKNYSFLIIFDLWTKDYRSPHKLVSLGLS